MGSNNELKEIDFKNRMYYYFDDIMKVEDIDFDNILLDKKQQKNILIYNISHKTSVGTKP